KAGLRNLAGAHRDLRRNLPARALEIVLANPALKMASEHPAEEIDLDRLCRYGKLEGFDKPSDFRKPAGWHTARRFAVTVDSDRPKGSAALEDFDTAGDSRVLEDFDTTERFVALADLHGAPELDGIASA